MSKEVLASHSPARWSTHKHKQHTHSDSHTNNNPMPDPLSIESAFGDRGLFWQYPVITEQEFYKQNRSHQGYLGFPWATVIDKKIKLQSVLNILRPFLTAQGPRFTCCQHISFRALIPFFKHLNIQTVYSPHKIRGQETIQGVKIVPCPLYAVNVEDPSRNAEFRGCDFLNCERNLLYSFVGGLQRGYLSDVRQKIFERQHPPNALVINTGDWHFNSTVYSDEQNSKRELNGGETHMSKTRKYNKVLLNSRYSLCPSGSGPNSIRLWESLACGAIPVLLADTLELPSHELWDRAIVRVRESDVGRVPEILSQIGATEERIRRQNCLALYAYFRGNYRNIST
jgi:hypothetical protein